MRTIPVMIVFNLRIVIKMFLKYRSTKYFKNHYLGSTIHSLEQTGRSFLQIENEVLGRISKMCY